MISTMDTIASTISQSQKNKSMQAKTCCIQSPLAKLSPPKATISTYIANAIPSIVYVSGHWIQNYSQFMWLKAHGKVVLKTIVIIIM